MDFWDVVRLMVRRWYVSAPMLILTAAALFWTAVTVSPNHTAEAHVMVLPPTTQTSAEPGENQVLNPWTTDSLAGALVTTLRNRNLVDQLEEEGFRAAWEVGLDLQFQSVIRIEVTSPTEHEAQEAVSRLLQAVANEVETRQSGYEITEGEKVTATVLSAGENTNVVRGNQVRALVVVFGACMIVTMGLTIGVDALSRRRHARGIARIAPAPEPAGGAEAAPTSGGPPPATNGARIGSGRVGVTAGGERRLEVTDQPGIKVSYRPPPARATASVPPDEPRPRLGPDLDDATVVLPLSGTNRRREDRSGDQVDGHDSAGTKQP